MKTKEIRDLIDFISRSELNEVQIETEELKLSIRRNPEVKAQVVESVVAPAAAVSPAPTLAPAATAAPVGEKTAPPSDDAGYVAIKSPMIGTFYRSPNPDSPVFVNIGDKVEKGQTVCIVEAMKLFNEIESEVSGTIVKAVAENSSPVEYDQVLFLVDPS